MVNVRQNLGLVVNGHPIYPKMKSRTNLSNRNNHHKNKKKLKKKKRNKNKPQKLVNKKNFKKK